MQTTDIAEAREAFAYWSRRSAQLPWHRRAARREARELAARWRVRLIGAHLERWRLGRFAPVLVPLLDTRGRSRVRHVRRLAWIPLRRTPIGRFILVALAATTAAALGCLMLVALLTVQLLGG
ncbi:MAG TPA: hypothetical protein VH247_11085 [Thermoleophilaceae bacterium]|jgi:hypothetical protein|nr:hypothetical protein [Thermoleophilaceae bacterium]